MATETYEQLALKRSELALRQKALVPLNTNVQSLCLVKTNTLNSELLRRDCPNICVNQVQNRIHSFPGINDLRFRRSARAMH